MTLTSREAGRAFTCSSAVGCCVGAITGTVTVIASNGAPIALVAGVLRPVLPRCRAVGSGLAGVASGGVVASVTGLSGSDALLPRVTAAAAAVGAWIGLGRIYGRTS